jgi:hypothetical protein
MQVGKEALLSSIVLGERDFFSTPIRQYASTRATDEGRFITINEQTQ